ncbi:MAG: hypothetical protein AABW67_04290 [Nanoarchaeota archaeon]
MKNLINYAKILIRENKVKEITPNVWEVENNNVIIKTKKGRQLISCSCSNFARFNLENPICSHKISVILFKTNRIFLDRIDRLKIQYEKWKTLKFSPDINMFLSEINSLEKEIR